jgi:hypothetical protein
MSIGAGEATAGKQRTGTISNTHPSAINPHGRENLPRFQGPGRKFSRTKMTRMATGRMKAMYCAIAPIENIAPIATGPPKTNRFRRHPIKQSNHTCSQIDGCSIYLHKPEFESRGALSPIFATLAEPHLENMHKQLENSRPWILDP